MSSKALSEEELGDLLSSDITSGMQRFGLKHESHLFIVVS